MTTLYGYRRHGEIGFRNHILIIPSVFCANKVCFNIAEDVENVVAIEHAHGCGQIGDDLEQTKRTLIGTALNPNAYGVIVVGLGCEDAAAQELAIKIKEKTTKPVHVYTIQDIGDTYLATEKGKELARNLVDEVEQLKREPIGFDELSIGFIPNQLEVETRKTSALLMEKVAEDLLANESTVVYGDYNEMLPAYKRLLEQNSNSNVKEKLSNMMKNMEGSNRNLSELEDFLPKKGLLTDVVHYAEFVSSGNQLVYMHGPNHNLEQITGLAASGVHLVVIGTANGSITGSPIAPVVKVSATNELYDTFSNDLDFNAGPIQDKPELLEELMENLRKCVIETLNGTESKSEEIQMAEFGIQRIGLSI